LGVADVFLFLFPVLCPFFILPICLRVLLHFL